MVGNYRDYVTMAFREQGNKYSLQKMGYTFQSQMSHFPALGTRVTATDRHCRPLLHVDCTPSIDDVVPSLLSSSSPTSLQIGR